MATEPIGLIGLGKSRRITGSVGESNADRRPRQDAGDEEGDGRDRYDSAQAGRAKDRWARQGFSSRSSTRWTAAGPSITPPFGGSQPAYGRFLGDQPFPVRSSPVDNVEVR